MKGGWLYDPTKSIIILIGVVIHNVEEPKLINPLTGAHNPQPISQLLLLQEFLRPIPTIPVSFCDLSSLLIPALIFKSRSFKTGGRWWVVFDVWIWDDTKKKKIDDLQILQVSP